MTSPSTGESLQLHVLLALAVTIPLAGWSLLSASTFEPWTHDRWTTAGAVLLGSAARTITVFLLLTGWMHFPYGEYAIPIFDAVSDLLRS